MAPGLNSCQTGTVPKNKPNRNSSSQSGSRANRAQRDFVDEFSRQQHIVDSDNGELSWGLHSSQSDLSASPSRLLSRLRSPIMANNELQSSNNQLNAPDRLRVINKLSHIQTCIREAEDAMNALQSVDSPAHRQQLLRFQEMLPGLQESERKLKNLLDEFEIVENRMDRILQETSQVSRQHEDSVARCEESRRKVEVLEKKKKELQEMQQRAERRLAEAEAEKATLFSRAQNLNSDIPSNATADENLQVLRERLRNIERICNETSEMEARLNDQHEQPEHPEEDGDERAELSDTETDYQLVQAKMAEINAMKAKLAHYQNLISGIKLSRESSEGGSDRRSTRRGSDNSRKSKSNQGSSQQSACALALEDIQRLTRDLIKEKATTQAARERLALVKSKITMAETSSSPDDSGSEPPSLLPASVHGSPPRRGEETQFTGGNRDENGLMLGRSSRTHDSWNLSLPTLMLLNDFQDQQPQRREPRSTQSSIRNGPSNRQWVPPANRSDLQNARWLNEAQQQLEESAALLDEIQQQEGAGRGSSDLPEVEVNTTDNDWLRVLCMQHQTLTRTVSQCCRLVWFQQRQIVELRNILAQQQRSASESTTFPIQPPDLPDYFPAANQRPKPPPAPGTSTNEVPTAFPPGFPLIDPSMDPWLDLRYAPRSRLAPMYLGPSGTLNNQVPPGNRANNYWDNFRSYSRQNLLSTSKSNEDRSSLCTAIVPPNNQTQNPVGEVQPIRPTGIATQCSSNPTSSRHQQIGRSRSVEPRLRNDVTGEITRDNIPLRCVPPTTRSEQSNSRLRANLNHRSDINNGHSTSLNSNIYQEVSNFILANENRPTFLIQLFQNLQRVTTELLRQRTLQSIHEVVATQNDTRNNRARERESNLNRGEDNDQQSQHAHDRIDQLFQNLRDNQETIRRNMASTSSQEQLEAPTTAKMRNHVLRDLRSYFEGNLCDFGHGGSTLKNPNVSNLRENISEGLSGYERMNPKNVYESLYDQLLQDLRRRSIEDGYQINPEFPDNLESDVAWSPEEYDLLGRAEGTSQSQQGAINNLQKRELIRQQPRHWLPDSVDSHPFSTRSNQEAFSQETFFNSIMADNADLAEADQSRNETSRAESEHEFSNFALPNGNANFESIERVDIENGDRPRGESCPEGDVMDNFYPNDGPSIMKNCWVREGDAEVKSNRQRDNFPNNDEGETSGRQLMDIAGALEHLTHPQDEETLTEALPDADPEADWEQENALDQVPTRLQKTEERKQS